MDGLYFPGYTVEDAAADLGDSAITETNGLGGFAMAASPAIVQFVGGTPADATANSRRMLWITLGSNPAFTLPALNFGGTPAGIDARLVADSGVLPIINTGIAHQKGGRRTDRRRHHHGADGVLQRRPRGPGRTRRCPHRNGGAA